MSVGPESSAPTVDKRIAIVEDHQLLAESLSHALTLHGYDVRQISVPDRGGASATFVTQITRARPRVVLLDLDLGGFGDAVPLIEAIVRARCHVVVLTGDTQRARWGEAIFRGARVVLSKSDPLNAIISAVRRVNDGLPVLSTEEREEMVARWRNETAETAGTRAKLASLTAREATVLGQLMTGMAVRDIAVDSMLAEATVRSQVRSLLSKLEVSSQVAAIGLAYSVGWAPPKMVRD
jgi:two-component system, NarL family, nitrate/nitrite response regulator NarL